MQRFVKKIVDLMREEKLFSWQGGPIIMLQVVRDPSVYSIDWIVSMYFLFSWPHSD